VPVDPLAALGFAGTPVPSTAPTLPDHVPALRAAFVPPALKAHPQAPEVAPREAQPRPPAGPVHAPAPLPEPPALMWHGDPRELWAAFCEGAGVAVQPAQGVNPELMRLVGSMLHAAVAGTLQLMTVRATAKHELRAQVTMIQARNNNPLKFSPDARAALEQMLQPPVRGFLAGPAAMTDAMHDLVGHTIGTMAGTRAALEGVLDRFTPQQLEAKLAGKSVLDSVLPMNRKAKLWELYLQHFEAIRNEAHDDFQSLFGRAFLAAYEQQLDRLEQQDRPAQGAR
jgi:FHA domain-containing protein